ncbi:tRNA (5-methylaminomethyl-2-thiouridine)(34)-methyltransferase MnmD [Chryseobacterium salivictor]|uniref:tRNA 5-methylaminomethyl-2-thiouridine biosynthesis bifunctional protein MnmC n=1 Tax=Chryseobacterium salivictor TaxID=2547600 RepID=A0A4P6ZHT5_9FLAO|nr:tRNA (5-methylaminomethyl-2-thiouridine)(34)-methyltransferase MnmD [Chryseobacterium salivictor]QBO59273.1 tRNA 5-methylaminomethyl-2-thiouridine biosynthesis bifunctional protein MnmC [Chryseobacterium salivictor]
MEREIKTTSDGSKTLYINDLNENYHSHHGALQEAQHVFIDNGLNLIKNCNINILELGFGTGLNVLVTIDEFLKTDKSHVIHYFTLEKYPINEREVNELDYGSIFHKTEMQEIYQRIHASNWNETVEILPQFFLTKYHCDFFEIKNLDFPEIDLVYFDCFGARVQPDLWEKPLFEMVANTMKPGGLLTTYSSKGSVRRILEELGFNVEKKAGPPGKREMINAVKN